MEKIIDYKTGIEIHKKSYKVLVKELGVVDFIRFIQEFEKGVGNYTEDRHKWQDRYCVEDILREMRKEDLE